MNVPIDRKPIYCQCFDPDHWMLLSCDIKDWQEYGVVEVWVGNQYLPWWLRIKELWNLVRHGRYGYAWMILSEHEVAKLRAQLDALPERD